MLIRFLLLFILISACKSGEIACPKVKGVKLRSRPGNYMKNSQAMASAKQEKEPRFDFRTQNKNVKSAQTIEEWDCPRPGAGGKTGVPKAIKANIKKNRKKFDDYYKNRSYPDSVKVFDTKSRRLP
jgi:hypothetical protein